MTDHDDLLARADRFSDYFFDADPDENAEALVSDLAAELQAVTAERDAGRNVIRDLAAALRAVTAERDENERILILLRHQRDKAEAERDALRSDLRELFDLFIEGGWAEAEDLPMIDRIYGRLNAPAEAHAPETDR